MAKANQEHLVGIDVGSRKVMCVVAQPSSQTPGMAKVLGFSRVASCGIRKGIVYDVEEAVDVIRRAVTEAQTMAGVPVKNVWAAIGGADLRSANCRGVAVLRSQEVRRNEVLEAQQNARDHIDKEARGLDLLATINQGYTVGEVSGCTNPLGLQGASIEAQYHAVYGARSSAENLRRTLQRAGLDLSGYTPHPWASASAVLSSTDMEAGSAVIDIGAQTTSLTVFTEGIIRYTQVKPWGADYFTRDIAAVLGVTMGQAEELKCGQGHCLPDDVIAGESVWSPAMDGRVPRRFSRALLAKTLYARACEMMEHYRKILCETSYEDSVRIITLTGGGSRLRGISGVAESVFGKTVRIGRPANIEGVTQFSDQPEASVVMGLVAAAEDAAMNTPGAQGRWAMPRVFDRVKHFLVGSY